MTAGQQLWAIVPVKSLPIAKRRLSSLLDPRERQRLARVMFEDVLEACLGARSLAGIVVVTGDAEVAGMAQHAGARVVRDAYEGGTNAAIQNGLRAVIGAACGIVAIPADIPHITAAALDEVVRLCREHRLVLVPASRDGGTNIFACSPPHLIEPSFGAGSFMRHQALAAVAGIQPVVPWLDGLDLDLDYPEDLDSFLRLPLVTRTHRVLLEWAVPARLSSAPGASPAAAAGFAI
jgi:2-phospho-L-lactate guanylyltransferase